MRHLPPRPTLHGRAERSHAGRPVPASSRGGWHGSGLCLADRHGEIPDDAATRTMAAPAVFPRRQRPGSSGSGQSLRPAVRPEPHSRPESRPGRIPEVALSEKGMRMATEFVAAIKTSEIPVDSVKAIDVRGARIAVANVGGAYYAFDDGCTHE